MAKDEKVSAEQIVRDIRRQTRRKYNTEETIRIVVEGLCGEASVALPKVPESHWSSMRPVPESVVNLAVH